MDKETREAFDVVRNIVLFPMVALAVVALSRPLVMLLLS